MDTSDIVQDPSAPLNYTALATQTEGYSVTDLKDLVARAVHRAAIRASQLDSHEESQRVCVTCMLIVHAYSPSATFPADNANPSRLRRSSSRLRAPFPARREVAEV